MNNKPKRRGRPPKGSGETKDETFLLRMDAREKEGFSDAASFAGLSLSSWMRERLRTAATKELKAADKPNPFLT